MIEHDLKKQSQFAGVKMNVNVYVTKDYADKSRRAGAGRTKANKANLLSFSVLRSADRVKVKKRDLKKKANFMILSTPKVVEQKSDAECLK
jgi:hypothetical protein